MLFSDVQHQAGSATYALSSTSAVAALTRLRQHSFPQLIDVPRFIPRGRHLTPNAEWLTRLLGYVTPKRALAGVFAALLVVLATALPTWAALQQSASAPSGIRSSAGVTGTAATRVEDLAVTTFVGQIPFVQQLRYVNAVAGTMPASERFVLGARQASISTYLEEINVQVGLPYLSDATSTKAAIDAWVAAEAARNAALASATGGASSWQAPLPVPGTHIQGARVTFYACLGNGFCGTMANGQQVFDGAAACSTDLPFGTRFVIESDPSGRVFTCLDRGALAATWVDVWFYNADDGYAWQSLVGNRSAITIVE